MQVRNGVRCFRASLQNPDLSMQIMETLFKLVGHIQRVKESTLNIYVAPTFDEGVVGRSQSGRMLTFNTEYRQLASISRQGACKASSISPSLQQFLYIPTIISHFHSESGYSFLTFT
jgi:hypothetical protein